MAKRIRKLFPRVGEGNYIEDGKGEVWLFPAHAGDFATNVRPGEFYPPCFREGKPKATEKYTEKELEDMGMVGLYMIEDQVLFEHEEAVPSPPWMLESEG